jgi:hypothetical protein
VGYPDKVFADVPTPPDGKPPRYDDARRAFADGLHKQGVRVVDLWPLLTDTRANDEQAYCHTDTHFSPLATLRIAQKLAGEFSMPINVIGVRGSGATPARINLYREGRSNPGYIEKKKLVIWCFTARQFTEGSGWRKPPVAPKY